MLSATNSLWSLLVFAACLLIFSASVAMFWLLDRRWTRQRHWSRLSEWARARGWRLRRAHPPELPATLQPIATSTKVVRGMSSRRARIMQVDTAVDAAHPTVRWNLLVCPLDADWPPTALRPSGTQACLVDLFQLGVFAALSTGGRFTVVGTDSAAARRLSDSAVRGLLPPDLALLLAGNELILDFSMRPFDPLAFDRMLAIVDQIIPHLPIARRA